MENAVEILLVEDNPQDAEMAIRALKKNNLANHLIHVKDGEEALDFIFTRGAFSDRKGKSNPNTKTIPVVVLTSSKEENDMVESYKLGVNSYIVKPVDFDKFINCIKDLGMYWLVVNQLPNNIT
jgi:DNA-binding NtrC family response regulator